MPDVTFRRIDDMDGIYGGVARRAHGLMVLALDGDTIVGITGFATLPAFAAGFGLPATLPD